MHIRLSRTLRVRNCLLLLASAGLGASALAGPHPDTGYNFRDAAQPNWHPLAVKLQPQLKEFEYAWSNALSSCYNQLHSRYQLGGNAGGKLSFTSPARLRETIGDLWSKFSQDPPDNISEGCRDDYFKAQSALKNAVEIVNGLDLVSPGPATTPFQKETKRLHMEIEAARMGMLVAFCKSEFRKAFDKAVAAHYPQDFSGSFLGDGPISGASDVGRVATAEAILASLPTPSGAKGEVRCTEEYERLRGLLSQLKEHLGKGKDAAYLKTLPPVSPPGAADCVDFLVDSSGSMDSTVSSKQQSLHLGASKERLDWAKADILRQIDAIKANPGIPTRVGLSLLGRNGIYSKSSSDCEQAGSVVPLAALQKNETEMRSWVDHLFADGSTPLAAGWVLAAQKLMRCQGAKTLYIATDGNEECGGGNPCDIIDALDKFDAHIDVKIVNIGSPDLEKELRARYGRCGAQVVTPGLTGQFHFEKKGIDGTVSLPKGEHATAGRFTGDQKNTSLRLGTSSPTGKSLNGVVGHMGNDGKFVPNDLGNGKRAKGTQTTTPEEPGTESSDVQTFTSRGADSAVEAPAESARSDSSQTPTASNERVPYSKKISPVVYGQEMNSIADIENRVYGHMFPKDSDEARIQRLEKHVFGAPSEGAIFKRVQRLRDVLPADKDEALPNPVNESAVPATKSSSHAQSPAGLPQSNSKSLMSPLPQAGYTPAAAEGLSSLPMATAASPDPHSAEIQKATESVLRPGVYHGKAIDPDTGKPRACTVAVTYSGQWNFDPHTSMVQVNAWFNDEVPKGAQQINGKLWSVAFGQPDDYSASQNALEYAPKMGSLRGLKVPVPVLSDDSRIQKGALEITGRQIGYRFADEHPDQELKRTLQGGYQFTRPVTGKEDLRMVEKSFKVGATMDRDCNLSEITIGVQNTDLQGQGSFTKEAYDSWKAQPKPFTTNHTMKCTGLTRDAKTSLKLPAHEDTCQKAAAADASPQH